MATNQYGVVQKNWLTAFILSLFFGWLGADRFYLGKAGTAVLKLITLGGFGIWYLIDLIMIATKSMKGVEWVGGKKDDKKKAWIIFGVVLAVGLVIAAAGGNNKNSNQNNTSTANTTATPQNTQPAETKPVEINKEPAVPAEYNSALAQADTYASTLHLSKQGVYDQLVSQYGGKFTAPAAQYAIDNVKADWNANALAQAKTYQNDLHLSPAAVHDQLVSQNGGKFTAAEADYAIAHLND